MKKSAKKSDVKNQIWFVLLVIYIFATYFAQDVLLPARINSIALYTFLGYSVFAIISSGKIKITPIFKWEIVCMALAFISMLYSPSISILGGTYYMMIVNFVLVFILTQMPWNEVRFNIVLLSFVVSAAVLMLMLILTGNLTDNSASGRLGQELMGNANIFSLVLCVGALYAIWAMISFKNKKAKLLLLVLLIFIYFGMLLSGSRKFIVAPIIFFYVMLLVTNNRSKKQILIVTAVSAVIIFSLYYLMMNVPSFYDSIGHRFDEVFALFEENNEADGSTVKRIEMIKAGFKKWIENPIWGYGFDSYKHFNATSVTGTEAYSHNNYIELLYNQGIIGLVVYYSFYIYLFIKAAKAKIALNFKALVFGVLITWLYIEFFIVSYSATPVQMMLAFCVICTQTERKNQEQIKMGYKKWEK